MESNGQHGAARGSTEADGARGLQGGLDAMRGRFPVWAEDGFHEDFPEPGTRPPLPPCRPSGIIRAMQINHNYTRSLLRTVLCTRPYAWWWCFIRGAATWFVEPLLLDVVKPGCAGVDNNCT